MIGGMDAGGSVGNNVGGMITAPAANQNLIGGLQYNLQPHYRGGENVMMAG